MDHANEENIKKTLKNANEYRKHLQDLSDQLEMSISQVEQSANKTKAVVTEHFSSIIKLIAATLGRKRDQLLSEISTMCSEALVPLVECQKEIVDNMTTANAMVREGENILKKELAITQDQVSIYLKKSAMIGILPEVPNPAHVASMDVHFSTDLLPNISSLIHEHGEVTAFSPVQIIQIEERPGGLVIYWTEMDEDCCDSKTFGLQYCFGNVRKNPQLATNYELAYEGPDIRYLVRDLQFRKPYSFRVSHYSHKGDWKRWSEAYVAMTTIPCYEWESGNPDYSLTNNNRIATKLETNTIFSLYSKSFLQKCNHSIMFHILEMGEQKTKLDEGLALVDTVQCSRDDTLLIPGVIFINMQGNIYVDGKVMTTHLSPLRRNSVVTFDVELLHDDDKVRVTIHTGNSEIKYDWKTRGEDKTCLNIKFCMFFASAGYKISVE